MRLKKTKILKKIKHSISSYRSVVIISLRDDSIGNVNLLKKLLLGNNILLIRLKGSLLKKKLIPNSNNIELKKISGNLFLLLCNNSSFFSIFQAVSANNLLFCVGWYNTFFIDARRFSTITNYKNRTIAVHNMLNFVCTTNLCVNSSIFFAFKKLLFFIRNTILVSKRGLINTSLS